MTKQEYEDWLDRATLLADAGLLKDEPVLTLIRHVQALQERIDQLMDPDDHDQLHGRDCLCSFVQCACSYEHPDAVCMVHAARRGLSLGEQPHRADGCSKRGRPHLGPCVSP